MVPVSELYKYYEEHLYENVISGTLDAAVEFGTPKTFTPIFLTEIGDDYLVCYIEDASFTIRLESALEAEKIDLIKNSLLQHFVKKSIYRLRGLRLIANEFFENATN